ncbi:glycerophosphoinositol inositolphosphodiesterase GDPD2-like isoform X1 [Poeciliopsis prolifica]|uniref:glycerophosphoinositol inositolphosphodiesterase GDPD2-like isoform X1 n=1 Tax=Poeciliopsis prolifica TaxID=188132 RepID=UPI002412E955|nr:glycerophosphoinositol inositolphosphodiesterase GDPD2-like isoform X1 [Poeciliopsis prolifica]XP_054887195.1 glycerophosphoinositol inositolphosphodiesterase GDPD2-like isoform X1 [Poeciliopsis prolifica]
MALSRCCRDFSRAFFSCRWEEQRDKENKCSTCWCIIVTVGALISVCWVYIWLVIYNNRDDFNTFLFSYLHKHGNYFMVAMIIFALSASYCVLLLLFALVQVVLQEKLDLHWIHKVLISLGMLLIITVISLITKLRREEWHIVSLSFQYTAPFLQFGAVGALTLLSWLVFRAFHRDQKRAKFPIAVLFLLLSAFIYLCPLLIDSPCLIDIKEINLTKPDLWGHRGAPMLAPENTLMSFERSATECKVKVFETDVQLSKDRIPFLMHDHKGKFLKRTTDTDNISCGNQMNISELKSLNAGKWFIKNNPFQTVDLLNKSQRETAENQTVPSLRELLELSKRHNIAIMFDLYRPDGCDGSNDTEDTVKEILNSSISHELIYWLPPENREYVKKTSNFIQVYNITNTSEIDEQNVTHLNVKYSHLNTREIRELRNKSIKVNLYVVNERWLFSLLWCAGASSVTTNNCQVLSKMEQPDWIMAPSTYIKLWISVDAASILIMIVVFVYHWKHKSSPQRGGRINAFVADGLEIAPLV